MGGRAERPVAKVACHSCSSLLPRSRRCRNRRHRHRPAAAAGARAPIRWPPSMRSGWQTTASGRIEDALKDVAGLTAFRRSDSRSANPTSQGVTLRSLGGNAASRALVLLDGVPIADPFAGYLPWSALDPARLGSVQRGARRRHRGVRRRRGGGHAAADQRRAGPSGAVSARRWPADRGTAGQARRACRPSWAMAMSRPAAASTRATAMCWCRPIRPGGSTFRRAIAAGAPSLRLLVPVGDDTELQVAALAFNDDRVRGLNFANSQTNGRRCQRAAGASGGMGRRCAGLCADAQLFGAIRLGRPEPRHRRR